MTEHKIAKSRSWSIIVYPESTPKDWREILDNEHIEWVESPLHDKDTNPDGEIKKAHWHILLIYDGPTTFNNVLGLAEKLNAPIPQKVASARGLVRYMIHMDNPEKYQYDRSEIVGHGGVDIESFFNLTATNRLDVLKEISLYIKENQVTSFADLVFYAIENNDDWFNVIANYNTLFLNNLINDIWRKSNKGVKNEN